MIELESTERIAFEDGELDGTANVPRPDLAGLRGRPELRFSPQYATYFLNLNCPRRPLDDPRVRRALALAIDRQAIVKSVVLGGEKPAFNLTPPELYQTPPPPAFADARYEQARRLLTEAGYPQGRGFPKLRYIYNTLETHRQIAQVLQETWRRELGIDISIENQEFKVVINNRHEGNFDIARNGWVADFADPINFLEIFDSKSDNNDSHWLDPRYDALLAACRAESDPRKREGLLRQAEAYLMAQMPLIPLYYQTTPYLVAPELTGYVLNPMDAFDPAEIAWKTGRKQTGVEP
jgi:oligopeptide transport system substrate-binding protein